MRCLISVFQANFDSRQWDIKKMNMISSGLREFKVPLSWVGIEHRFYLICVVEAAEKGTVPLQGSAGEGAVIY